MPSKEQWSNSLTALAALVCMFMGFLLGRAFRSDPEANIERAVCVFSGDRISGFVTLATRSDGRLFLYGKLMGIEGMHGVHIHDFGNLEDDCRATGSHFNPLGMDHGDPTSAERHAGDLGNLNFDRNRTAILKLETTSLTLTGPLSVVGRSLVVHQRRDDLGLGGHAASLVNGASGERLACCVIAVDRQHSNP